MRITLLLSSLLAIFAAGCTYSPHYDRHEHGSYRYERHDRYGGYYRDHYRPYCPPPPRHCD